MARCWSLRWCNWAGEGERGEREWLPCFPSLSHLTQGHTRRTLVPPPRVAAATAEYRQDCHYHTAARGDRRQRSSVLRFLSVPHPHCDALHAVGLKLGWGRARRNTPIPSTTYPQGAPLPWPASDLHHTQPGEEKKATLNQTCCWVTTAPFAFKNSMIHGNLQFTLPFAPCCVLHRHTSQEIHCSELSFGFLWFFSGHCFAAPLGKKR